MSSSLISRRKHFWLALAVLGASSTLFGAMPPSTPKDTRVVATSPQKGCVVMRKGERLQIPVGDSVLLNGRKAQCQLYDGHPVLIFSAVPPLDLSML